MESQWIGFLSFFSCSGSFLYIFFIVSNMMMMMIHRHLRVNWNDDDGIMEQIFEIGNETRDEKNFFFFIRTDFIQWELCNHPIWWDVDANINQTTDPNDPNECNNNFFFRCFHLKDQMPCPCVRVCVCVGYRFFPLSLFLFSTKSFSTFFFCLLLLKTRHAIFYLSISTTTTIIIIIQGPFIFYYYYYSFIHINTAFRSGLPHWFLFAFQKNNKKKNFPFIFFHVRSLYFVTMIIIIIIIMKLFQMLRFFWFIPHGWYVYGLRLNHRRRRCCRLGVWLF